jgi:hypothetical protein
MPAQVRGVQDASAPAARLGTLLAGQPTATRNSKIDLMPTWFDSAVTDPGGF